MTDKLADVLFEIGAELMAISDHTGAVYWLGKAQDSLNGSVGEIISYEAHELRSTTMQYLIRALFNTPGEEARRRAWMLSDGLNSMSGNGISKYLIRLDLYDLSSQIIPQDYHNTLLELIQAIGHLTEAAVDIVLRYAHKLRCHSSELAHSALMVFLAEHLVNSQRDWLERVLVMIIWNVTTSLDDFNEASLPEMLKRTFDKMSTQCAPILGHLATHAVQMVRNYP